MRRISGLILLLAVVSAPVFPCRAGSQIDMPEGLWEITAEVEMAGVPVRLPAITLRQCITPDNLLPDIDRFNAGDSNCKITNLVIGRSFAAFDLACALESGEMKGHGTVTFRGERLQGSLTTVSTPDNERMRYEYSGFYLGPCR